MVVIGNGNYAIHEVETLKPITNSVTILTNGEEMIENRDITVEVLQKKIHAFRGNEKVEEIEDESNRTKFTNV